MPSFYPNADEKLLSIRDAEEPEAKIKEIINCIQQMGEQIRYQFRHVELKELSVKKLTGILGIGQGGTGAATAAANKIFAGPSSGDDAAPSWRKLVSADIPNLNASKITAGILAVARGGTGMSEVEEETTVSNIVSPAGDITINTAYYRQWGKVAMLRVQIVTGAAHTSGSITLATVVSGKRPSQQALANVGQNNGYVNANGEVIFSGTYSAGQTLTINSTYIVA